MTNVNIVYDDVFDDADIIAVPDEIVSDIEKIGQEFMCWSPPESDDEYWVIVDGRKCLAMETDGFLKWLNSNCCQNTEKAYVIARNTNYCPGYKIIEF